MIGTDRSIGLLTTAREKSEEYQLFAADSIYLPLREHSCDAFISIAVIHHFSTEALRRRALEELARVTKIGGEGLVYVWAYEQ
jgi:ubiquinone/menaquinone biosynthesis C-methylase UbiE